MQHIETYEVVCLCRWKTLAFIGKKKTWLVDCITEVLRSVLKFCHRPPVAHKSTEVDVDVCWRTNWFCLKNCITGLVFNLLGAMRHFCGFAGPPRCAIRVALTYVPQRALQMQMRELYDQSEYLLWFSPCFFRSSRRRKLFLDRFLQGESVAESGSIISHYFRTYFSLYVVPRGLRHLPGEWTIRSSIPACAMGIFPGQITPVT